MHNSGWKCWTCQKLFKDGNSGRRHVRDVHGPRKSCPFCAYTTPGSRLQRLHQHIQEKHSTIEETCQPRMTAPHDEAIWWKKQEVAVVPPSPGAAGQDEAEGPLTRTEGMGMVIRMGRRDKFQRYRSLSPTPSSRGSPSQSPASDISFIRDISPIDISPFIRDISPCSSSPTISHPSTPSPVRCPSRDRSRSPLSITPDSPSAEGYDPENPGYDRSLRFTPIIGDWNTGDHPHNYTDLSRDPRLFFKGAPSQGMEGKMAGILRRAKRRCRVGSATVTLSDAGSSIRRIERAESPNGSAYQLESIYVPPPTERSFCSVGTQCTLLQAPPIRNFECDV